MIMIMNGMGIDTTRSEENGETKLENKTRAEKGSRGIYWQIWS